MEYIEFIQKSLANSVERLISAEAEAISNLGWIADKKIRAIEKKVKGKTFKACNILDLNSYRNKGISSEAVMQAVIVSASIETHFLVDAFKEMKETYRSPFSISIYFMQDPDDILKSKAKITDKERRILREMKKFFNQEFYRPNGRELSDLNNELRYLKHEYNIVHSASWSYSLSDILSDSFLSIGLRCNNSVIV